MRTLRLLAIVACPAAAVSFYAGAPWAVGLGILAIAGSIAAVIVGRHDREDQRLDTPPTIR